KHPQTSCLLNKFQQKTLGIIANYDSEKFPSTTVDQHIAVTWANLANTIYENAKHNEDLVVARVQVIGNSNVFLHLVTFLVETRQQAETVALQMMILHGLLIE